MTVATLVSMPHWADATLTIVGLALVTLVTRGFFLYTRHEPRIPRALRRALQVAPLAAIVAVLAPEIVVRDGLPIADWRDARLIAAAAATAVYVWRPGLLPPLVAGLAVYLPLRLAMHW